MFRGRLMFPIQDLQGRPIALGGRVIPAIASRQGDNAGGKYINGRETMLFRKSHQLYGLDKSREAIRREGQVLVMEGYTDVVAAWQSGIDQVVAVLGTALGEQHVRILKRFAERVVLVLDGDAAGQRRADEVLELFVSAAASRGPRSGRCFGRSWARCTDPIDRTSARRTGSQTVTVDRRHRRPA
jgi:DNA primase